jgi:hypothetical protein
MKLGTGFWREGTAGRTALVAELPADPGRVVDLNRLERLRQAKLGEGWSERLADARVPADLRGLLEGGPRALLRARRVVAYAEKWHRRGGLPESLAPCRDQVRLLPCLPQPRALRQWDGSRLDALAVQGPGDTLGSLPTPTLALVGLHGERPAGCCLALEHAHGIVLGAWLELDPDWEGALEFRLDGQRRRLPMDAWRGLVPPRLEAGEVVLAPPPRLRVGPCHGAVEVRLAAPFETLVLHLAEAGVHPTMQ